MGAPQAGGGTRERRRQGEGRGSAAGGMAVGDLGYLPIYLPIYKNIHTYKSIIIKKVIKKVVIANNIVVQTYTYILIHTHTAHRLYVDIYLLRT
jgi:hypothetical protein